MKKRLALSDEILLSVDKPERYLGNEGNVIKKDPSSVDIRFAICFPDVYEIGMSHLGIQILYEMFNRRPDLACERVYSPWVDLDSLMREKEIPLFALESQRPVREFDFLGITLQYELCYTNILQILDLSGIPLYASERLYKKSCRPGSGRPDQPAVAFMPRSGCTKSHAVRVPAVRISPLWRRMPRSREVCRIHRQHAEKMWIILTACFWGRELRS